MRSKWKRLLLTTMAVGMLSSATAYAANVSMNLFYNGKNHTYNAKEIVVQIDGKKMTPKDMPAVAIDDRTMLPMRQIAQELGCEVVWNEAAQQVYVVNDDYTLVFEINKTTGIKNGKTFTMDVPPMIVNDRTMLPVRALATALDLNITWDDPSRTVSISTKAAPTTPTTPTTPTQPTTPNVNYVTLNKVDVPASKTAGQTFTIQANGAIPSYEEILVADNKIVLDFYGAKSGLASNITTTNSSIVSAVRTAQHTAEDGSIYTRVVLDLNSKKKYEVTQSADKTKVYITFSKVTVDNISMKHNNNTDKDVIEIEGDSALGASVSTLANPNRIVVDIPNSISELDSTLDVKVLDFVTAGRTAMFNETTLRIVFEVGDLTEYSYTTDSDSMTLQIYRSTMKNMSYDANKDVLYLQKKEKINTGSVKINDHYLNGYVDVVLPGDYEDVYGYGTYEIGDDVIKNIQISTNGGKTTLRFNQSRISCYSIKDDGDRYIIHVKNPKDVYDKVLLLDAGHGGNDPGTSGNGLVEKTMNLTIAQKVRDYLGSNSNIKVYMTRESDSARPANADRAKTANEIADFMVAIHMNSGPVTGNGTETLYAVHSNDASSKLTSLQAAQIMQSYLPQALSMTNRGVKLDQGILILNSTKVPAILVEVCFLTNPGDAYKISMGNNQDIAAEAIGNAIIEIMNKL